MPYRFVAFRLGMGPSAFTKLQLMFGFIGWCLPEQREGATFECLALAGTKYTPFLKGLLC